MLRPLPFPFHTFSFIQSFLPHLRALTAVGRQLCVDAEENPGRRKPIKSASNAEAETPKDAVSSKSKPKPKPKKRLPWRRTQRKLIESASCWKGDADSPGTLSSPQRTSPFSILFFFLFIPVSSRKSRLRLEHCRLSLFLFCGAFRLQLGSRYCLRTSTSTPAMNACTLLSHLPKGVCRCCLQAVFGSWCLSPASSPAAGARGPIVTDTRLAWILTRP
ncbi:hypothetical protein K438DRAFT_94350 [Mycena galopus ATCC 62051]|nr:hypothetical protein K438DRAFT_94350 [Mycena galopus ATCC 62051]